MTNYSGRRRDRTIESKSKRAAKTVKRNRKPRRQEQPTDLLFWFGDGLLFWLGDGRCGPYRARVAADTEVSIGQTDSKRALGFVVRRGGANVDPPPLKWSDLRYVFGIKEDCNGKEAIQA
jgi:hypothetical protein